MSDDGPPAPGDVPGGGRGGAHGPESEHGPMGGDPMGPEPEPSSGLEGFLNRLVDPDAPGPSVQEIQGDYGFDRSLSMIVRGVLRAAGGGMPPIGEIGLGSVMYAAKQGQGEESSDGGEGLQPPNGPGGEP